MITDPPDQPPADATLIRLIGVYDADGTMWGELKYFVGARLGKTHCSLCEITHGLVRERGDWRQRRNELPVPFDAYHRNDQPSTVRAATGNTAPVVVAEMADGIRLLLGPSQLEQCGGSEVAMVDAIGVSLAALGIEWPRSAEAAR